MDLPGPLSSGNNHFVPSLDRDCNRQVIRTSLGWVEVGAPDSIWWWIHTVNYSICLLGIGLLTWGLVPLFPFIKTVPNHYQHHRSVFWVRDSDQYYPSCFSLDICAIAPIIILIWAYGIWKAIVKDPFDLCPDPGVLPRMRSFLK